MDAKYKREWYLKNKEKVDKRERARKEALKLTPEYLEKMFIRKLSSYHHRIIEGILPKKRTKGFDKKAYIKEYRKKYDVDNADKIREYKRVRHNERYATEIKYRIGRTIRSRLYTAIRQQ